MSEPNAEYVPVVALDTLKAQNLWGPLGPEPRKRLEAVITKPTDKTWDDAYSLILNNHQWTTLWQAVIKVDPTFPKTGPTSNAKGKRIEGWKRVPSRQTLLAALRWATHIDSSGGES